MRVLLLTHNYEPEVGAPQQRWGALVRRFRAAGHDVSVITPPPRTRTGETVDPDLARGTVHTGSYGETVLRVAYGPYADRLGSRLADQIVSAVDSAQLGWRRFRRTRPDVVIATAPAIPTIGAGAALSQAFRVPLITEMRDAWPDLITVVDHWDAGTPVPQSRLSAMLRPPGIRLAGQAIASVQRHSDAVVSTTESFATALKGRGIRNVHVVRNGAHGIPGYAAHARREPDGELHVLYLGTVGRAQGLGTAVLAMRRAHAAGVPVRLRIVGSGAEHAAVAEMAAKGDIPIEVLAHVPRAEVARHYAWADSLLVALRPWPALSLAVPSKLYEGMALGLHVTASLAGEAADIVAGTGAGTVVPPGDPDALARTWGELAADPTRLEVGAGGRAWTAEHADNDRLADHYLTILDEVTRGR